MCRLIAYFTVILSFVVMLSFSSRSAEGERCRYINYRGKKDIAVNEPEKDDHHTIKTNSSTKNNVNSTKNHTASNANQRQCHGICKRPFAISKIDLPPYSTADLLGSVLRKCCGECLNITVVNQYTNVSEVTFSTFNNSDFVLPMLGYATSDSLYGYHFIPLVNAPNVFYLTPKDKTQLQRFLNDILDLYPLIVLCLLLTIISGFIVWFFETWNNSEEYPRHFLNGLFEGFWYSFVSMTTVGYGDKIVKSAHARLFAVLWILTGITMFGFLTSTLTNELMKASSPIDHSMTGSNVGVLQFRDYDASLAVKHEGIIQEAKSSWNFYTDVMEQVQMLRLKKIHGMILDKYTLAYTTEYLEWKKSNIDYLVDPKNGEFPTREIQDNINFFINHTSRTMKTYKGKKLCYGVLIKNLDVYKYFKDAITDNRLPLEITVESEMNILFPRKIEGDSLFSQDGEAFQDTLLVLAGILCFICVYGIIYEMCNRCAKKGQNQRFTTV